ncbi:MAG: hypothetical protein IKA29_01700 [Clostridia bacterium]|nr:hypothetical protein [Clostridia bacterium]
MSDTILEFAQSYHTVYKNLFNENAAKLFDNLVASSGVDVAQNRRSANEYRTAQKAVDSLEKKTTGLKVGKGFAIFGIIVAIIAVIVCCSLITENHDGDVSTLVIIAIVAAVVAIGLILLITLHINKRLKHFNELLEKKRDHAKKLYQTCIDQISPLFGYFKVQHTYELCQQTLPEITFDKNFSMGRYFQLHRNYGFQENLADNESTLGIFSGEILGNPFVEERRLIQSMGTHTYHGSITIHWTSIQRDSKDNTRTVHHTQTLHASVTKPKPYYHQKTTLIYGNDAAPDLSFSHEPTHAERWTKGELERKVRRGARKIEKMAEKSLLKGGTFTEFGNEEFDVIFNATERDHEVQFRLLFTPLAQKNLLFLMKNPKPYGDDFYFVKRKKLNYISSEHGQRWNFDPSVDRYLSYDVDVCKKQFLAYNNDFFCNIYHELAPLMCIPLYQQHKAEEYIYGQDASSYRRNFTSFEAECLANTLNKMSIAPDDCQTEVILKTQLMQMENGVDKLMLTAHGFTTIEHVDYISTFGGDGRFHNVPVRWLEYIPVQRNTFIEVRESEEQQSQSTRIFKHGLLAQLLNL